MTLKECYAAMGADYDGVLGRLRSEKLVQKFTIKFLDDASFGNLCKALEERNYEEAFRAAHTIKGVCQNLGFSTLYESSNKLTEALRSGASEDEDVLLAAVRKDYQQAVEAICALRDSAGA